VESGRCGRHGAAAVPHAVASAGAGRHDAHSYALLLEMLAHVTGYKAGEFIHTMGDAHIYSNHMEQVATQLARTPHEAPRLIIKRQVDSIFDFTFDDFAFENYNPDPVIKAPVAV